MRGILNGRFDPGPFRAPRYLEDYKARGFDLSNIDIPLDEMVILAASPEELAESCAFQCPKRVAYRTCFDSQVWSASQFTDTIETFQDMLKKLEDNAPAELTEKVESLLPR